MAFKALKACNFDRRYIPGEIIPAEVVYAPMAQQLKMMGLIADTPAEAKPEAAETIEKPKKPGRKPKN